ncbi:nuclear transport factor 2 family protein [Parasphingorhabdus sp.]|uniref:nuclear transport factor 2 family protein n=1 Tax=Parasphingorhabdus sp. TaxID=2709688 RepID=UPI003A8D5D6A
MNKNRDIARAYFAAIEAGTLPDDLLADDFTAWTTTQGPLSKELYQGAIPLLAKLTGGSIRFTVDSITAEADRVIAEARATARLVDGSDYENTYVFVFRIRDGRISSIAEHFNALVVIEKLVPLISQA